MTPVGRLRLVGLVEGTSFLILLAASAVKRLAGYADPVLVLGSVHGVLFVLFIACVVEVTVRRPWYSPRFWAYAAVASVVPFGTFVFDRWLVRHGGQPADRNSQ